MNNQTTLDEVVEGNTTTKEIGPFELTLPQGWEGGTVGDVISEAQYGTSESLDETGDFPIIRMNNIENGYVVDEPLKFADFDEEERAKYRLHEGDILFNRTNSLKLVGKTGIFQLDRDCGFASYLIRLVASEDVNNYYLNLYLNQPVSQSRMKTFATKGVSQANINASNIQKLPIHIPPLQEQRRISTVLRTLDEAIEKIEEVVEQANQVKKGLIQQFYSRGYYDHDELQQVDMQDAYVMTRTDDLPATWDIKKSGDIAEVKTGHTPSTSVDEYWDGEISWVDIHDLTQLEGTVIHSTDDTITEEGLNNSGAKLLPEGTLVLCRTGAIGETAILGKEMATDQDQVTFECDESEVLPRYLMYLFEYATPQLERLSAGSTHDKVQLHFFSDLEIPLPEIEEQREIVDVLESVDEVSQTNKEQLDNLHRVKRGLMQDLLSGTVRTTDTNIEVPEEIEQHG